MISTVPTTLAGLAAMVAFMADEQRVPEGFIRLPFFRSDECAYQFIENLDQTLRRLTGGVS